VGSAVQRRPTGPQPTTHGAPTGSGEHSRPPEPRFLAVGRIVGVHGVRGELKVEILTEDPNRFALLERVFIGPEAEEPTAWPLQGYRLHKGRILLKLTGCDDRNTAETLRGHLVQVPLEEAIPLGEDEYYEHQIIGLGVWTVGGEYLGEIVEIIYTGANDVYVVHGPPPRRREVLVPAIAQVVLEVDLDAGRLTVDMPEELL